MDGRQRANQALEQAGLHGRVRELTDSARTAAAAASALGCDVGAVGNSLVFTADGAPVLVLTSGAHRVDQERLAAHLGAAQVRRATPEQVREATGYTSVGSLPSATRRRCRSSSTRTGSSTHRSGRQRGTRTRSSGRHTGS